MTDAAIPAPQAGSTSGLRRFVRRNPTLTVGLVVLALFAIAAIVAPVFLGDPRALPTLYRLAREAERDDRCLRRDVQRAIDRLSR